MEKSVAHIRDILKRLLGHGLYVKLEKTEFHVTTISLLVIIISNGNLEMDPSKIQAIRDWPQPSSEKQVQQFLGYANCYQKFIRNFSSLVAPLMALTKRCMGRFVWTTEGEAAFIEFKQWFTTVPTLVAPNPDLPFIVEVDGSEVSVGSVLS
ncbi:uncharacterized protein [Mobula birostris]|uniref:uncharacterized protein n=1 Tax=Mobula birostris TaxID=1983395 RepID=UPI003B28C1CE